MKTTKRALFSSVMALILCFSMLVGTTFAWFTDEVESGTNIIVAGNLDVELYHTDDNAKNEEVTNTVVLFDDVKLWEPGALTYEILTVANEGTLALKYQLGINFENATEVDDHSLVEALKVAVVDAEKLTSREAAIAAGDAAGWQPVESFVLPGELVASKSTTYGIVIYWEPTENDNWFNMNNENQGKKLTIDLGVALYATQLTAEEDSFGPDYDDGAYLPIVYTADELKSALENNESVQLGANIELTGEWTPIGDKDAGIYYTGTLDGNGYTISGLTVSSGDYVALISAAKDATIKDLTVEGSVTGANAAGIVARVEGNTVIENCVSNVAVNGTTKAGGIACNVTGANAKIINCTNAGNVSGGDNGIGGIVGYVNNNAYLEITNCANTGNVTSNNNKYAGAAVGFAAGTSTGMVAGFTNTGVITGTLLADGRCLKDGETVLCGYVGTIGNWIAAVSNTETLIEKIKNAPVGETTEIVLAGGTYTGDIDITLAALGQQGGDVVIKAADGTKPVFTGTVTLGYYEKRVGSTLYAANVTFEGITFDHAEDGKHSISVQNIGANGSAADTAALTLKDCTIIGDGECGIGAVSGCIAYNSRITGCTFVNAGIQVLGNFGTGLVVDGCTFTESVINIQGGNGVTVQNSTFTNTVTDANNNESFYAIRSNAIPVTVTGCIFNIDSTVTGTGVAGSKGWGVFVNRNTADWTVSDVAINMTEAALAQPALKVAACLSTGKINMTNVTVNGATYVETADALATAVTNGATKIMLANGEYDFPHLAEKANNVTFIGQNRDGVVIKLYNQNTASGDFCLENATATLQNLTVVTEIKDWAGFQNAENLTFNGCKFVNNLFTTGNATFNDCEFVVTTNHYNVWAFTDLNGGMQYMPYTLEFNRCVFNTTGKSIYVDGNQGKLITVKFNGCTFKDDDTGATNKAAIETGKTYGWSYDITITGCTFNGFAVNPDGTNTGSVIWANKASMTTDQLNVVIDGVDVY